MRALIFRRMMDYFYHHTPEMIKRLQLQILCSTTAKAFQVKSPCLLLLPSSKGLARYADFTKRGMRTCDPDEKRLYQMAFHLGSTIRRITGFTDPSDQRQLISLLYLTIGISLTMDTNNRITVTGCFFKHHYTPSQCTIMSSMDSGLISGILGGGYVTFISRITEGCAACKACHQGEYRYDN